MKKYKSIFNKLKIFKIRFYKRDEGFTLLELLIVIGILGVLSVALVFVLNPAESLKKARDSQRISDLTTLKKAIEIYKTNVRSPLLAGSTNAGCKGTSLSPGWDTATDKIYYSYPSDIGGANQSAISATNLDGTTFSAGVVVQTTKANLGNVDGTGWLPINFNLIPGGSPISALPVDPVNTLVDKTAPASTDLVYRYVCYEKDLSFELNATLESAAFTSTDNKMSKDGGNNDSYYEVGTGLSVITLESPLAVGDNYGGGKVAYILQSGDPGYDANIQHGLVAMLSDISSSARWGCYAVLISGADGTALGTGSQNTQDIATAGCTDAAQLVYGVTINGYNNWYLPSIDELSKLYNNRVAIGGFSAAVYLSSSEFSITNIWIYDFNSSSYLSGKDKYFRVRAIRSF